jgi:hypothetical protein
MGWRALCLFSSCWSQKPTHALKSVKCSADTYDLIPMWARTLAVGNCSWNINRTPFHKKQFKYLVWYLTHCCGLEMQKPTQALMLVQGVKYQLWYLIVFLWRQGSINIPWNIPYGHVLDHLGFKSKVLFLLLTNLSSWVGFWLKPQVGKNFGRRELLMGYL